QHSRRARIAQSSALPTAADEPASPSGDVSQGEAFPTVSGLETGQDRTGEDAIIKGRSLETGEEAVNILTSEVQVVSVPPAAEVSTVGIPTGSDQRRSEQIARDAKIARIHAEEELQMLIDGLDRNNKVIARHLREYEQVAAELTIGEKIELINEQVKYQDHHSKILNYQAQQSKPLSKKQQREFYMSVLKSHSGWKTKHFKGMSLEEIREKFIPVWKQIEDFVPMASKEEGEIFKRKGLREDLIQLWTLVKETLSNKKATSDKEKELWVELKDQEIFMLVEKDYPLRKGSIIVMISNKLQVENYSQMANDLIMKIYNIANRPRQRDD
nr:hypothetical protein [Tanacetum cinerariifolium]